MGNLNCCPQHPEMPALAYEYGVNNEMPYKPAREDQRRLAIGDDGIAVLAKCLPKAGLRSLIVQLSRNKITHVGAKAFAAAIPSDAEDLKLYFHANSFGDRGACSIAWKIKNMKKLKSLYLCLGCNEIHEQGNQMIAECLPNTLEPYYGRADGGALGHVRRAQALAEDNQRAGCEPLLPPLLSAMVRPDLVFTHTTAGVDLLPCDASVA